MTEDADLHIWESDALDGNQVVQVHRRFMDGANRALTPAERRQLLDALAHGNLGQTAERLGLRYMHVMYCMQEDGLKATVLV